MAAHLHLALVDLVLLLLILLITMLRGMCMSHADAAHLEFKVEAGRQTERPSKVIWATHEVSKLPILSCNRAEQTIYHIQACGKGYRTLYGPK